MSNSALIKSSLAKKYWMALTGLFLCLFLIGHLAGNFQLFLDGYEGKLQFNEYAVFMTSNPLIQALSYLVYFSILFHAIDGLVLTIHNNRARPSNYVKVKPSRNSPWTSRNMGILGTIILAFIVFHMQDFWYAFKFQEMPYMTTEDGSALLTKSGEEVPGGTVNADFEVVAAGGEIVGPVMKDLHEEVMVSFQEWWIVLLYVIGVAAIAFHLWHGFQSAFTSLGLKTPKVESTIKAVGYAFAVLIPLAFASIPVYIFFNH
ncbi:MAG TPA: succinate dehydrogenase cytochrome b subunit [Cryomorphaceae bacterium]|nr:succinate dehydrogenase cytochrome b subunit [Cryomorphaceae bacterium]HKL39579.1 succinate dehydrogenase cytochrome b subunit [Cryomorphaceae bacterium]